GSGSAATSSSNGHHGIPKPSLPMVVLEGAGRCSDDPLMVSPRFGMVSWLRSQNVWITALAIAATMGAWAWLIILIRRQIRRVRPSRAGRKGEDQVVEQLRQALDHRWTIYRNLQLPDHKDDLDPVLVGPGGIWAVQVKATGAPLWVHGGRWEVR